MEADSTLILADLPEEPTCRLLPSQHKRLQMLRKVMVPALGKWWVRKLGNMVTINREFQALYSVRELALATKLLAPGGPDGAAPPPSLQPPPTLLRAIEQTHNLSQLLAIRTCLCGRGVALIQVRAASPRPTSRRPSCAHLTLTCQGPPGTGKTKTILGILSVLLASESSSRTGTLSAESRGVSHLTSHASQVVTSRAEVECQYGRLSGRQAARRISRVRARCSPQPRHGDTSPTRMRP